MPPEQFIEQLRLLRSRLDLTASDLAVWFGRPRATMRTWLELERTPKAGRVLDECARRLKLLRSSRALPVPYDVLKPDRPSYIKQAFRDADNARVPARNSA